MKNLKLNLFIVLNLVTIHNFKAASRNGFIRICGRLLAVGKNKALPTVSKLKTPTQYSVKAISERRLAFLATGKQKNLHPVLFPINTHVGGLCTEQAHFYSKKIQAFNEEQKRARQQQFHNEAAALVQQLGHFNNQNRQNANFAG